MQAALIYIASPVKAFILIAGMKSQDDLLNSVS